MTDILGDWIHRDEEQYRQMLIASAGIAIILFVVTLNANLTKMILEGDKLVTIQMSLATLAIVLVIALLLWKYKSVKSEGRKKNAAN